MAFVAQLLTRNGVIALASFISPYRDMRERARKEIDRFFEVYLKCPLEECVRRDVKGLYRKTLAGTFVDGLPINPVLGKKKPGDFTEEAILAGYKLLLEQYFRKDNTVLAALEYDIRYAGPKEAIHHACARTSSALTSWSAGITRGWASFTGRTTPSATSMSSPIWGSYRRRLGSSSTAAGAMR